MYLRLNRYSAIAFLLVCIGITSVKGQALYEEWVQTYASPIDGDDIAHDITVDINGNAYVTGISDGEITTLKYSTTGSLLWVRRFPDGGKYIKHGGSGFIEYDVSNDAVIVVGNTGSYPYYDVATIKYSSNGDLIWSNVFDGIGKNEDYARGLEIDRIGNVYEIVYSLGITSGYDFATIKYSPSGESLWTRRLNGLGNWWDRPNDIAVDTSGNVYVTGFTWGVGTMRDYTTIKYNSSGEVLWTSVTALSGDDEPNAITVDQQGNVYVTGSIGIDSTFKLATVKYSSSGDTSWLRTYVSDTIYSFSRGFDIRMDKASNVYVTGYDADSSRLLGYTTIKYDSSGQAVWINHVPYTIGSQPIEMGIDDSDNVYVTGVCGPAFSTVRYSNTGDIDWVAKYEGIAQTYSYAPDLVIDNSGCVFISGWAPSSGSTPFEYVVIKYSPTLDTLVTNIEPTSWSLSQNYPNPFNPSTNIRFTLPSSMHVSLDIFNILGQKVKTLVDENLTAGYQQIIWDGTDQSRNKVASGIYFYRLFARDFSQTKKMVFLK